MCAVCAHSSAGGVHCGGGCSCPKCMNMFFNCIYNLIIIIFTNSKHVSLSTVVVDGNWQNGGQLKVTKEKSKTVSCSYTARGYVKAYLWKLEDDF